MMDRWHRSLALGAVVAVALLSPLAAAAGASAKDDVQTTVAASDYAVPIEGFMTLTGRIEVGADRRVSGYTIDRAEQVPDEVQAFLARQVAQWRIELDDGVAAPAEAVRFSVRLRASPSGDGLYRMWLDGVHLDEPLPASQRLQVTRMVRPDYPRGMAKVGASAIVYMLVLLDAEGTVVDVFAEQVDLTAVPADPAELPRLQLEFIASAATAVRKWRFKVPTEGPYAHERQAMRVPLAFRMGERPVSHGQWEYLVRGVRKAPPWAAVDPGAAGAIASTGAQPVRSRLRVATGDGDAG